MNKPGVSVIIVSWNTRDITDKCLTAMKKAVFYAKGKINVEVIVAENASDDGTYEMIAKKHPWVKLYNTGDDLGYGKGNNYGVKKSNPKYEYLLLLNNDAFVEKETLVKSVEWMEKNTQADVMGCQLRYESGKFQPSGGYLPTPSNIWSWTWGLDLIPFVKNFFKPVHAKPGKFFKKDREVGWVMGAFLFMRREVYEITRGFDEQFFLYGEEVEWCKRVKDKGHSIWYTPSFSITHIDKATAFGDPLELAKIFRREMLGLAYNMHKHFEGSTWWLIPVMWVGIAFRFLIFKLTGNTMRSEAYKRTLKELK
jgi:GT2 family glycosyltransferase